ncbi:acyl-CoA thioesterase [Aquifex sp.]
MVYIYTRRVQFYETDAQGVVHHSNYFRYFEEARGEFLRSKGFPYSKLREKGFEVVLLSAECEYKKPLFYDDVFRIEIVITELTKFTFSFTYKVLKDENIIAHAKTRHCIVKNGKIVSIPKEIKEVLKNSLVSE